MDGGVGTTTAAAASRPGGAMSLLDKYASINASIEDARRRVAEVRSNLDECNQNIQSLVEERSGMEAETEQAKKDMTRLEAELKEAEKLHQTKLAEKERVEKDQRLAKSEYDKMNRFIEDERMEFLERCREFRSSVKRLRVASSILVLEGGGAAGHNDNDNMPDEKDLWRRLQDEGFSITGGTISNDTKDVEVELAELKYRESRKEYIETEAALNDVRTKHNDAVNRSNARNQRLTQQRAQLQRHRKEVEDLEREIHTMKNTIVEENQLAHTYEKECKRKKQARYSNVSANTSNSNTSFNNLHTPPTLPSSGHQQYARGGVVTNPYNKQTNNTNRIPTSNAATPRNAPNQNKVMHTGKEGNIVLPHASSNNRMHGITPEFHQGQRNRELTSQQHHHHPHHHGGYVRNQRQFGTSVGISIDSGMEEPRATPCMSSTSTPVLQPTTRKHNMANNTEDSSSDGSSDSSDEDILSFNIFGKK